MKNTKETELFGWDAPVTAVPRRTWLWWAGMAASCAGMALLGWQTDAPSLVLVCCLVPVAYLATHFCHLMHHEKTVRAAITRRGVQHGRRLLAYSDLRGFSVFRAPRAGVFRLVLTPRGRMRVGASIEMENANRATEVEEILGTFLPALPRREGSDRLERLLLLLRA